MLTMVRNIKRIIFESISKFNGFEKAILPIPEIKQIAGRAGRYKPAKDERKSDRVDAPTALYESFTPPSTEQLPGYVTCFDGRDLPTIARAMATEAPPITTVGIAPPEDILQRFADHFPPQTPYSYVMLRLYEFARLNPRFFLCDVRDQMKVADALRPVRNLTISDLMVFCASPANLIGDTDKIFLQAMATCVADQRDSDVLELLGDDLEVLNQELSPRPEYMTALETLHRNLVLYIWLSYRFGTYFRQRPLATHAKTLVEDNINKVLAQFSSVKILNSKFKRLGKQPHAGDERVISGEQFEPAQQIPGTFDGTPFTPSSEENTSSNVQFNPEQQLQTSPSADTSDILLPIRKFPASGPVSRSLVITPYPDLGQATSGNETVASSDKMAQVPLLSNGLQNREANAERLPLHEKPPAVQSLVENEWYGGLAKHHPAAPDTLAQFYAESFKVTPIFKQHRHVPTHKPAEMVGLAQSHEEYLVIPLRSESLRNRNHVVKKSLRTRRPRSRVLKTFGSWIRDKDVKSNDRAAHSSDDQLTSNFFTASEKSYASEFFTTSSGSVGRATQAAEKPPSSPWASEHSLTRSSTLRWSPPRSSSSSHLTTINILDSLIAKAPSLRQKMVGLKR